MSQSEEPYEATQEYDVDKMIAYNEELKAQAANAPASPKRATTTLVSYAESAQERFGGSRRRSSKSRRHRKSTRRVRRRRASRRHRRR